MMLQRFTGVIFAAMCVTASAQTFPDKPVRVIVPYPPGGSTDLVGRILGEGATEPLGLNGFTKSYVSLRSLPQPYIHFNH